MCRNWYSLALSIGLACWLSTASALSPTIEKTTTFVVVRHAEKQTVPIHGVALNPSDPPLTKRGQVRANALARALATDRLYAVYATPFIRTQATAQPTATAHRLTMTTYAPTTDTAAFVFKLKADAQPGTVLIVGHSNTVPAIVAALCECPAPKMTDQDYGDRFDIVRTTDGATTLRRSRF
jgi:broad specificity phosphatase PhoE